MRLELVAALGEQGELGRNGQLLWPLREDLRHFKRLTGTSPLLMGSRTFLSLPRLLPHRPHWVLSRHPLAIKRFPPGSSEQARDVLFFGSITEVLAHASWQGAERIFCIGGGSVYAQVLAQASVLHLTRIVACDPDADTFFPLSDWDTTQWHCTVETPLCAKPYRATYQRWTRVLSPSIAQSENSQQ